jgi:hypothetical protein
MQEKQYWRGLIEDLQEHLTIAEIAEKLEVGDRQVWRWKSGDRPGGLTALNLYLLHREVCKPALQS